MQPGWTVFTLWLIIIIQFSKSVFGISVSVEITHEEHFEVKDVVEFDVIQVFNDEIRQELQNDEDIMKFEKSLRHSSLNVSSNTPEEEKGNTKSHFSRDNGEVTRYALSNDDVNMTSSLDSKNNARSYLSHNDNEVTTFKSLGNKDGNIINMTSPLEIVTVRSQSSSDEVGNRVNMMSQSLRHKYRADVALLRDILKMKSHLSRGTESKRLKMTHKNEKNIDSKFKLNPLQLYLKNRLNMKLKLTKQRKHSKTKNKKISLNRRLYRKYNDSYIGDIQEIDDDKNATILLRRRRKVDFNIDNVANADWKLNYTTGKKKNPFDDDSYQVISADDKIKAEAQKAKTVLLYVGTTVLSVVGFSVLTFCFIKDPAAFIIAFATGCPCFLIIIPCITARVRKFKENSEKMLKENVNMYMPGIIIHEDGTVEHYQTTPEEVEAVMDIIDELQS